jgi:hypothetical protein
MNLSANDLRNLRRSACYEISQSHLAAKAEIHAKSSRPSIWETVFVGHVCRAMGAVAGVWKGQLAVIKPSLVLSMASVFTHQSPMVIWSVGGVRKRCELSDVLLAIIDRTAAVPSGIATLVQAKLSSSSTVLLAPGSEQTQFDLLATRLPFDLAKSGAPKGIDLRQPSSELALMYGVTGASGPPVPCPFGPSHHWLMGENLATSTVPYKVLAEHCLAFTLVGMLLGNRGRQFRLAAAGQSWQDFNKASPRDDWSTLINYLLEETFSKALTAAHSFSMGRGGRGQDDLLYLIKANSVGGRRHFWGQGLRGSLFEERYRTETPIDDIDWMPHDPREYHADYDGGDSIGGGGNRSDGEPTDGGPMSAIVFEIGPRRE